MLFDWLDVQKENHARICTTANLSYLFFVFFSWVITSAQVRNKTICLQFSAVQKSTMGWEVLCLSISSSSSVLVQKQVDSSTSVTLLLSQVVVTIPKHQFTFEWNVPFIIVQLYASQGGIVDFQVHLIVTRRLGEYWGYHCHFCAYNNIYLDVCMLQSLRTMIYGLYFEWNILMCYCFLFVMNMDT
jgi:hypothetical protein